MESLLEVLDKHETLQRPFLERLDPGRTATLHDLLTDPDTAKQQLRAPWIVPERLQACCASAITYLDSIQDASRVRGYAHIPTLFFQYSFPQGDGGAFAHLLREDLFSFKRRWEEGHGTASWQASYLHTDSSFVGSLRKNALGLLSIPPLNGFSSIQLRGSEYACCSYDKLVIGYRVPDYPSILSVSPEIATDYLARIIVHDLGHGFLPMIQREHESVHNSVMIHAMQGVLEPALNGPWESLVYAELHDPFFFLQARDRITEVNSILTELSGIQSYLLLRYTKWYASEISRKKNESRWEIIPEMGPTMAREQCEKRIAQFPAEGFPYHTYCD